MVNATVIREKEQELEALKLQWHEEGEPMSPRILRGTLELMNDDFVKLGEELVALRAIVQRLCNALADQFHALAEKHGIQS